MAKVIHISFDVDSLMTASAVIAAVESKGITNVRMTQEDAVLPATFHTPRYTNGSRYAHGMRTKGIRGDVLVLQTLSERGAQSNTDLEKVMVDRGFALNGVSSFISVLSRGKMITKDANHKNSITEVGTAYLRNWNSVMASKK